MFHYVVLCRFHIYNKIHLFHRYNLDKSWNHSIWRKEKNVHKQIARIKEWSDYVIKYMNSDRNSIQMLSKETISYVDRMDKFNGQSFREVYPEYGRYI